MIGVKATRVSPDPSCVNCLDVLAFAKKYHDIVEIQYWLLDESYNLPFPYFLMKTEAAVQCLRFCSAHRTIISDADGLESYI